MGKALDGIRVIDMTHDQAGPSCTQMLAWLGAEVIKVEMADGRGDRARYLRRDDPDKDSFFFLLLNNNKKSVTLDLRQQKGKEAFKTLINSADVLVENRGPGAMNRLGLGYEDLSKINPRLVYGSVKGFGSYGPFSDYKCFEHVAQATSGAMSVTGWDDRAPSANGAGVGDSGTGMHIVIGLLAALVQRNVTGKGQMVEVAMQEAVLNLTRVRFAGTLGHGKPEPRLQFPSLGHPLGLGGLFPCAPGGPNDYVYMIIPPEHNGMFSAALGVIDRQDLMEDPRFGSPSDRVSHAQDLYEEIKSWTEVREKREVMAAFAGVGVPCGAVFDTSEVINQPHLIERGVVAEIEHPARGKYTTIGCPVRLSDSQVELSRPPLYGEHSDEVLTTLGGMTQEEVAELRRQKVII
ncbi:MAG: CoA transferase [Dehalococcoidia bacterium]|nr:CoA transferase [Dehalococcoidia bacterium]